jgi:hypothetical protein
LYVFFFHLSPRVCVKCRNFILLSFIPLVGVAGAGFDTTGLTGTAGLTADGLTMLGLTGAGSAGLAVAA